MMKNETSTTGNLEESAYAVRGKLTRNSILPNQEGIYDKKTGYSSHFIVEYYQVIPAKRSVRNRPAHSSPS